MILKKPRRGNIHTNNFACVSDVDTVLSGKLQGHELNVPSEKKKKKEKTVIMNPFLTLETHGLRQLYTSSAQIGFQNVRERQKKREHAFIQHPLVLGGFIRSNKNHTQVSQLINIYHEPTICQKLNRKRSQQTSQYREEIKALAKI